jgi:scaffold protein (connect acetoacetyl-CoA thiolase and HMG-CoA synthase)
MTGDPQNSDGRIVVGEGLFEADQAGASWLRGSRCKKCGEVVFPRMADCPNCMSRDTMDPHLLAGRGRLQNFVVARRGPQGFTVPYIQAYVRLEDGPVVYGNLIGVDLDDPRIVPGIDVVMQISVIKSLNGHEYLGWTFRPTATAL